MKQRAATSTVIPSEARNLLGIRRGGVPRFIARRARAADADAVYALITHYVAQGLLLPRSEEDVRTNIDHFLVLTQASRVIGCVALEPYGADLAEIRSLAVAADFAGGGRGARLLRFALAIAKRRKITRVFAVTHAPEFFERLGFARADRRSIVEKVERDCRTCLKRRTCALVAVVRVVLPGRAVLSVLAVERTAPIA